MTARRTPSAKPAMSSLAFTLLVLASSAALAAPKSDVFYDCVSSVQTQYQLDQSKCLVYLAAQRDLCLAQATQRYADAMAGCAVSASKASSIRTQVSPKQNLDTGFMRRLRF